jgi:ubiquitin-conjugating enzyme E2 A
MKDFQRFSRDPPPGCYGAPYTDNMLEWVAIIFGPNDTVWEGACLRLSLSFPPTYPNHPPTVKFITPMFHPNVYRSGDICLDILQNNWSPVYSVSSVLTSIQSLLTDPNPDSPANPESAQLYTRDRREYDRRVRDCVLKSQTQTFSD